AKTAKGTLAFRTVTYDCSKPTWPGTTACATGFLYGKATPDRKIELLPHQPTDISAVRPASGRSHSPDHPREGSRTMSHYLLFCVLGLSVGAVYAALSLGIVVTYQGTGVINFAAAAMATIPLYVYDDLRHGQLTLPLPWVPSIDWGPPPTAVAVLVALAI